MTKRYDTTSALVRYIAGVFSLVAFVLLFGNILKTDSGATPLKFADVFFGANGANGPHVYGFVAQILILLAGVFGVLIPIIGAFADKEKMFSFIVGIVLIVCAAVIVCIKFLYPAIEGVTTSGLYHLCGTAIASAALAGVAGALNIWAAFIKD